MPGSDESSCMFCCRLDLDTGKESTLHLAGMACRSQPYIRA